MAKHFRKYLAMGAAVVMLSTIPLQANAAAEKFTDVKPGKWYYTAVDYAVSEKLFSGTSSTTFSPEEPMTRGMFVTVLGNKAKIDPKDYPTSSFSDVKAGAWSRTPCRVGRTERHCERYWRRRFSPNKSVTREQMAVRSPAR